MEEKKKDFGPPGYDPIWDATDYPRYYDMDGKPMTMRQWVNSVENRQNKHVAKDVLPNGKYVSTVHLGLDHGFGGKPLIFETMVFPSEGNFSELDMDRYATKEEAAEGHKRMVEKWKSK